MNIERLAAAARAILQEFEKTEVMVLLSGAIQVAANRQSMAQPAYTENVSEICARAASIIASDVVRTFPNDIASLFLEGAYANALPAKIATVLKNGFNNNKNESISSSELGIYQAAANKLIGDLHSITKTFETLKLEYITVPADKISLDVMVPRDAFNNSAIKYIDIISAFTTIMSYLEEASGTSTDGPELVYSSTTDPVIGVGIIVAAVMPTLLFYEKILDIAKKQIDLLKSFRAIREVIPGASLAGGQSLDDTIKEITQAGVANAVNSALTASGIDGSSGRRAEISNGITMKSSIVVNSVANGARLSVSIESLVTLEEVFTASSIDHQAVMDLIQSNKLLEQSVGDSLRLLSEKVPLLEDLSKSHPTTD